MRSTDATTLIGAITFGFILLVLGVVLGWWRFTRPSILERRFIKAFRQISELGADRIVTDFFEVSIDSGITKDVFVAAVFRRCSRSSTPGKHSKVASKADALNLWSKLDEDGDGQVTLDEFVTFVCDLRDGKKSIDAQSKHGAAFLAFWGWWFSLKSQTLQAVIITHFQLQSSIPRSFPEMDVKLRIDVGVESNSTASLTYFQKALGEATGALSNLNVAVFEIFTCFLGPRHEARLLYTTATALTLLAVASAFPRIIRCCLRGKRLAQHDSNLVKQFSESFQTYQLVMVFLVYPALTQTIMRTFVCKEYAQDDQGNPTFWLVDDTVMQCETVTAQRLLSTTAAAMMAAMGSKSNTTAATAVPSTSSYLFLYAYAWCMVVMIIIGFPAFIFHRLW
jgi:hypothetical protein